MNPQSERRFPLIPFARADAGASPGARFLRAKGPAPYQPRATPWVTRRKDHLSPEGATQTHRPNMARPYRANRAGMPRPRALPWAGMGRTVGAEIGRTVGAETARIVGAEMAERDLLFHDTVAPHLAAYAPEASAAQQRDFLTHLHQTLNAPSHPIRNRLLRLTADSPDLLAIIKQEGKV